MAAKIIKLKPAYSASTLNAMEFPIGQYGDDYLFALETELANRIRHIIKPYNEGLISASEFIIAISKYL